MIPQEIVNIEKILVSFLGESKNGMNDNGQLQFGCPRCIEEKGESEANKFNLEVNLYNMVYKCWSCGEYGEMSGKLSSLIKKYGNKQLYEAYKREMESLSKSRLYDIGSNVLDEKIFKETFVTLPKTFTKINLETCPNVDLLNYLSKRRINQYIIDKFNLGYTTNKEKEYSMRNRIIIPSYDSFGDLNYWVGRDFTGKSKMKYKNCDADKTDIVFQESTIDFDADIILCEGAIDCLYPFNAISMLGKTLKKNTALYSTLMEKANANVFIWLDYDTKLSETKSIYKLLNFGRLQGRIGYIRESMGKDIGEIYEKYGKKGLIYSLNNVKNFTELEIIFE